MRPVFIAIKKWFLLTLILTFIVLFFVFNLKQYLNFETIKLYQAALQDWTYQHYYIVVFAYILIFSGLIACTIPCATILTLLGGFLFGSIAIIYAVFSTTLGGLILLLAIRSSIGSHIAGKASGWIKKLEAGFQSNAFFYILMLRLMPVAPCWISNIAAGALNVPIRTFILATVIGVTPATIIYALAGRGLDKVFSSPTPPNMDIMFTPSIFLPLLGLALLSIFPVLYKRFGKR